MRRHHQTTWLIFLFIARALIPVDASALNLTWNGPLNGSGACNDKYQWLPNQVPGSSDNMIHNRNGNFIIDVTSNQSARDVLAYAGNLTIQTAIGKILNMRDPILYGNSAVTFQGGSVTTQYPSIAHDANSIGSLKYNGATSTASGITVGRAGPGQFYVQNNSVVMVNGYIYSSMLPGSTAFIVVEGSQTRLTVQNALNLGVSGSAQAIIRDGAVFRTVNDGINIGNAGAFGNATLEVYDALAQAYSMQIHANGDVVQTQGAVEITNAIAGSGKYKLSGGSLSAGSLESTINLEWLGGTLSINNIAGNLVNSAGILSPGRSVGVTNITGDYTQRYLGALAIELAGTARGTQYDAVSVSGLLDPGGTLAVTLKAGYSPSYGDTFDILDWGSISGAFNTLQLPELDESLAWDVSQLYSAGTLSVTTPGIAGDFTGDGVVDSADYVIWRKSATEQSGYNDWRAHFGQGNAGNTLSLQAERIAIPEPRAAALVWAGFLLLFCTRLRITSKSHPTLVLADA